MQAAYNVLGVQASAPDCPIQFTKGFHEQYPTARMTISFFRRSHITRILNARQYEFIATDRVDTCEKIHTEFDSAHNKVADGMYLFSKGQDKSDGKELAFCPTIVEDFDYFEKIEQGALYTPWRRGIQYIEY